MIKLIAYFRRKRGTTVQDFRHHWATRHAELVMKVPGLRRYLQNHTHESGYRKHDPSFDGVAEVWFDDLSSLRADAPEWKAVRQDEGSFIDADSLGSLLV